VPLLATAVVPLAACGDDRAEPEPSAPIREGVEHAGDPLLGKTVTVEGEVLGVASPTAFRLSGENWDGEPLRVVDAAPPAVVEGESVRVTGVVREYEQSALEDEFDLDLDAPALIDWTDGHVLVARTITPVPGD
jgi:hypothetical protein